jgi:hypothetical protein
MYQEIQYIPQHSTQQDVTIMNTKHSSVVFL